ncbi:hypothetical protein OSTOST_04245 [Ostertagia ostertagi]
MIQIASQAFYTLDQKEESLTFPDGINALRLQMQNRYPWNVELPTNKRCDNLELTPSGRSDIDVERERLIYVLRKCLLNELGPALGAEKLANILLSIASFIDLAEKRRNYLEVCDLMSTLNLSSLAKGVYLKQFDLYNVDLSNAPVKFKVDTRSSAGTGPLTLKFKSGGFFNFSYASVVSRLQAATTAESAAAGPSTTICSGTPLQSYTSSHPPHGGPS